VLARVARRSEDWRRLSESFEVDASILGRLGWRPPVSFEESFRRCAEAQGLAASR
jgi:hypothetical protein